MVDRSVIPWLWICGACCAMQISKATAQPAGFNYDEALVPEYVLPDPLIMEDGTPVTSPAQWREHRRPEVLELFRTHVFGRSPAENVDTVTWSETVLDPQALKGAATLKEVAIQLERGDRRLAMTMLLFIPHSAQPVPAFLGLNFGGNHTVHADPRISITSSWVRNNPNLGVTDHRASEEGRGGAASRWQVERIVERGYALATIYYGDIDPDFDDGFENGVHALFNQPGDPPRTADSWGTIAGWAWGLSRALDYLEHDPDVDAARVAVIGHSRLGKTALWAGASDERFALVISNNSGCGGAALSRRRFGETVERINTAFPHWFCDNHDRYNGQEDELPVDHHQLIALIAPRPVYVASATEDLWADPRGEYLSCVHADPVYRLLGTLGLERDSSEPPPPDEALVQGTIGYHLRTGSHDVTAFDWEHYLDFADRHLRSAE